MNSLIISSKDFLNGDGIRWICYFYWKIQKNGIFDPMILKFNLWRASWVIKSWLTITEPSQVYVPLLYCVVLATRKNSQISWPSFFTNEFNKHLRFEEIRGHLIVCHLGGSARRRFSDLISTRPSSKIIYKLRQLTLMQFCSLAKFYKVVLYSYPALRRVYFWWVLNLWFFGFKLEKCARFVGRDISVLWFFQFDLL